MPTIVDQEPVTDAIIAALAATTKPVGDMNAPTNSDGTPVGMPYCIVYPVPGGTRSGPWAHPQADVQLKYQITSVGYTRKQAQWMADRVREVMIGRAASGAWLTPIVDPTGMGISNREADDPVGVERTSTLYEVPDTYTVTVSPA